MVICVLSDDVILGWVGMSVVTGVEVPVIVLLHQPFWCPV